MEGWWHRWHLHNCNRSLNVSYSHLHVSFVFYPRVNIGYLKDGCYSNDCLSLYVGYQLYSLTTNWLSFKLFYRIPNLSIVWTGNEGLCCPRCKQLITCFVSIFLTLVNEIKTHVVLAKTTLTTDVICDRRKKWTKFNCCWISII